MNGNTSGGQMAADMTTLQGEIAEDTSTHADVEQLLASFLEALLAEQAPAKPQGSA